MSFKTKKQKQVKKLTGNLSIEYLHQEKLKNSSEEELNEYFLNTCYILKDYYETKDEIHKINPYEQKFSRNTELEKEYYKVCGIQYSLEQEPVENCNYCMLCKVEMLATDESFFTCPSCGDVGEPLIEQFTFQQTQDTSLTNKFVYKRINYFNDWLRQIQGNEITFLPEELMLKLNNELVKRSLTDYSKLKPYILKKILKEIKEPGYYENIQLIISKLTNKPSLIIPDDIATKLKLMFSLIQQPYELLKGDRKNFFSYPYILHKFCQLLELYEYLEYFPRLKSREKILTHDILWKKICHFMQEQEGSFWRFIPSC